MRLFVFLKYKSLTRAIERCLDKANNEMAQSISIPIIGRLQTGLNPFDFALQMIYQVVAAHKVKSYCNLKMVKFVIESEIDYSAFHKALLSIAEHISLTFEQTMVIKKMTQSSNHGCALNDANCDNLHFSAICYREYTNVFTHISVYSGTLTSTECDAIVNMTTLCSKHQRPDVQLDNLTSHIKWQKTGKIRLNCMVYDTCPFCSPSSTLEALLVSMDGDRKTIVAIPLLNTEMDAGDIRLLINVIRTFTMKKINNLNNIDFITDGQDRAREIATWMQMDVYGNNQWDIIQHWNQEDFGIKAIYISQDINQLKAMQLSIEKSTPCFIFKTIDVPDFVRIDHHYWQQIALRFWCQFNAILIHQTQDKLLFYGSEEQISKAISAFPGIIKNLTEENIFQEIYNLTAQEICWYVNIFNHKAPFDKNLNFQLENGYKKYIQDKRQKTIQFDHGTMLIDFNEMSITIDSNRRYSLGKQSIKGL